MAGWTRLLLLGLLLAGVYCWLAPARPLGRAQEVSPADASSNPPSINGKPIGPAVPSRPGDICIVCNNPVAPDDPVYIIQGQRVPVHAAEKDEFFAHPEKYLAHLKPLGGALLGADSNQPGTANRAGENGGASRLWIYAGLYVLAGLVFAALCAQRALSTGYSPWAWFGLGLFLSVLAYAFLLTRARRPIDAPAGMPAGWGKIAATRAPQPCPKCGALNHPAAERCLGCAAPLSPSVESEAKKVGLRSA